MMMPEHNEEGLMMFETGQRLPWQMTREEFLAANPRVIRVFHQYSVDERTTLAASFRTGYRQRQAAGQYFYMDGVNANRAYRTAKEAKIGLHRHYIQQAMARGNQIPPQVAAQYSWMLGGIPRAVVND
jgi:hypothetical protein